jgi:aminomethyltransferase
MVPFAGWEMPVQYVGLTQEHHAVRNHVGLFDVSHMGEFRLSGRGAPEALQNIVTGDISKLKTGAALYTLLCMPNAGIVDDIIVYRVSKDSFFICVNASNTEKDANWFKENLPAGGVEFENVSDYYAQIAVQGPSSFTLLKRLVDTDFSGLLYYHFLEAKVLGVPAVIARTGYTGELGYEIYFESAHAPRIWNALVDAGKDLQVMPCGLGARDTLRVEVGFGLYGQDMNEQTNPFESSLSWAVDLGKENFIGKAALLKIKETNQFPKLVGYVAEKGAVPRAHHLIFDQPEGGNEIGEVTSGIPSPSLGTRVGFCRLQRPYCEPGRQIYVDIRGNRVAATTGARIFYKNGTAKLETIK